MSHLRNHPILILLFLFSLSLSAQKNGMLEGHVVDSSNAALPLATVSLLQQQDSVLVSFGITDGSGRFVLRNLGHGDYLLQVSYVGYAPHYQTLSLTNDQNKLDLGFIVLEAGSNLLDAVEIVSERDPMRFSRDTVIYNADAFKTQAGAVVEDLLKQLPGLEVEADGSIRAQGETVQNVLVNGKEFFGNDPSIATKNLPADIVDKVAVYDKKSDRAEFTGIEDGRDEKTINLKLKKDKASGQFGRANAGYGTDGRFEGKANLNRFTANTQLSLIGMGNNTNDAGFSFNDYMRFMGGLQNMGSAGGSGRGVRLSFDPNSPAASLMGRGNNNGINTTWATGINLNQEFGSKTQLNGSYFYNRIQNDLERNIDRENILEEDAFRSTEMENRLSRNKNHRLNLSLRHEIDSSQYLMLRANAGINDALLQSMAWNNTFGTNDTLQNESQRDYLSTGDNWEMSHRLSYHKRFGKAGRALFAEATLGKNNNQQYANINSLNRFYADNMAPFSDTLEQQQDYLDLAAAYSATISYTEPVGKGRYLELLLTRQNFQNDTEKDFFDREKSELILNENLSNRFDRTYRYDRGELNLLFNGKKYNLTLGTALQQSTLVGKSDQELPLNRQFTRILPRLFLNYEFGLSRNFNLEYETRLQEPSLEQLQPVVDNSDPLNVFIGNPDLKPEYVHSLNAGYFLYDQFSFTSFFANLEGQYTKDRITNSSFIDSLFRRSILPINVDQEVSLRAYTSFSTPLRFIKSSIRIGLSSNWSQGILYVNELANTTRRLRHSLNISLENRKKDKIDARIGWRFNYNETTYSVSKSLNQDYSDQRYFVEASITPSEKWFFRTQVDYTLFSKEAFGDERQIVLWQASIGRYVFANNRGQISLKGFDLLQQNTGINRNTQLNYVEEERVLALGRYFLLSFGYSLSGFGKEAGGIEIKMME
ncbi:MAG TPA: TonB-dependent receptor [Saprospiraceae bacterium]|nr:TonB-dependent receptor [Saprospiraceae bacterium]HMQ85125.1 TonB-dependent receptor [Saprospiraceae bacterium]